MKYHCDLNPSLLNFFVGLVEHYANLSTANFFFTNEPAINATMASITNLIRKGQVYILFLDQDFVALRHRHCSDGTL